jgi:formylglycine-generating enzyme required for sulfatase activity/serine/threonine protein phosphatase PrpC
MKIVFDIASDQIDGARDYQEDAFLVTHLGGKDEDDAALVIMADGMGGHAAGNVASNMVVSTFSKTFSSLYPTDDIPGVLSSSVERANDQIGEAISETPGLHGMGCTMVTAFCRRDRLWWISVGDSHLYLIRDGELSKKNADHSYGAYLDMMRAQGMEIDDHPGMSRNMLMSAMTGEEIGMIDLPTEPIRIRTGDRILICSDGLDTLSNEQILQVAEEAEEPRECVDELLDLVKEAARPHQDNTTVIVVDVEEIREEAPPAPPAPVQMSANLEREMRRPRRRRAPAPGVGALALAVFVVVGGGLVWSWHKGYLDGLLPTSADRQVASTAQEPSAEPSESSDVAGTVAEPAPEPEPLEPPPQPDLAQLLGRRFSDPLAIGGRGPEMITIKGGDFRMGGPPNPMGTDETPRRIVHIESFAMSQREVTFAEYDVFARATGRRRPPSQGLPRASFPVFYVSWNDANAFAKWLSAQTGHVYRLPTEAEWEYAARAGTFTSYWWGTEVGEQHAHCFGCNSGGPMRQPIKVGSFKPNAFGLYDTSGNVWEWVQDCYNPSYEGAPATGSAWESGDCALRVARGGSFENPPPSLRNAKRGKFAAAEGHDTVGIRLVREIGPALARGQ